MPKESYAHEAHTKDAWGVFEIPEVLLSMTRAEIATTGWDEVRDDRTAATLYIRLKHDFEDLCLVRGGSPYGDGNILYRPSVKEEIKHFVFRNMQRTRAILERQENAFAQIDVVAYLQGKEEGRDSE